MESKVNSYSEIKKSVLYAANRIKLDTAVNDDFIIVFILLLKYNGLLDYSTLDIKERPVIILIENAILNSNIDFREILLELWNEFNDDFRYINVATFKDVVNLLNSIENNKFKKYYSRLVDDIIYQITKDAGKRSGMFVQPLEITKLVSSLCSCSVSLNVYNPFAGFASYGIELNTKSKYFAQELNSKIWALGVIRLLSHTIDISNYKRVDSVSCWEPKHQLFDIIVSSPPFGFKVDHPGDFGSRFEKIKTAEEYFLARGIEGLKATGKLVGVFSTGFLFRGGNEQNIRQKIVERDILEMVISLPVNLLYNTSISTSILVINMDKKNKGVVKMIDASTFVVEDGRRNKLLNDNLFDIINNEDDYEYVKIISNDKILENDYNLSVNRYFEVTDIVIPQGYKTVNLEELLTILPRISHSDKNGKFIQIGELSSSPFEFEIDMKQINAVELRKDSCKLASNGLLLAIRFKNLKPTYVEASQDNPIYFSFNIIACSVDQEKVDMSYLIYQLNSDFVQKQINLRLTGNAIPMLNRKDLLKISILLPNSIEEQKSAIIAAKEVALLSKAKELGLESLIQKMKFDYINEIRIKKHNLAQHLNNIQSSISSLVKYIDNNSGVVKSSDLISKKWDVSVEQHIKSMFASSEKMGSLLNQLTEEYLFGTPKIIDLHEFIKNFIISHNQHDLFEFEYQLDEDSYEVKSLDEETGVPTVVYNNFLNMSEQDLTEIFDNILSNAIHHGFIDLERNKYIFKIEVVYISEGNYINILFSNNGKPFPKGMTSQRFTLRGEKAGLNGNEGIGGYRVKSIVEYYGGKLNIINDENSEFSVTISINLPKYRNDENI